MTIRENILAILSFERADKMPAVMFGFWHELLVEWEALGKLKAGFSRHWGDGNELDEEILSILGADYNWQTMYGSNSFLSPGFEHKVVGSDKNGFSFVQNSLGVIESVREGAGSIPAEHDYLLKDRESFEKHYRHRLQPSLDRVNLDYLLSRWNNRNKNLPFGLHLGSLFGDIRNMLTVTGMSYLMCDDIELLEEICTLKANLTFDNAKVILDFAAKNGIVFDYAHYWEDICFKNGPLLSPSMFEQLCGEHYQRINDLVKSSGIKFISLDCDGVIEALVPTWVNHGVNVMFPIEVGVWGDQFEKLRDKYGKSILGVGAMDKTVLRKDKKAVDEEIERMKKLVKLGGFIPCPDHRLMPGTNMELTKYYFAKIKEML